MTNQIDQTLQQKIAECILREQREVAKTLLTEANPYGQISKHDLRKDYDEKVTVDGGVLYRKNNVIQVWWKSGRPETWTHPAHYTPAMTKSNFDDMADRWTEKALNEDWEPVTKCQQCQEKLSKKELTRGDRVCQHCVGGNKGRVWGKDSDDLHESALPTSILSLLTYSERELVQKVCSGEKWLGDRDCKALFDKLYDYFFDEMPYDTRNARDEDPTDWIHDRLEQLTESTQTRDKFYKIDGIFYCEHCAYDTSRRQLTKQEVSSAERDMLRKRQPMAACRQCGDYLNPPVTNETEDGEELFESNSLTTVTHKNGNEEQLCRACLRALLDSGEWGLTMNEKPVPAGTKCPSCKHEAVNESSRLILPDALNESVDLADVQRVYDEQHDVGETEVLCGISHLKVSAHGDVISFVAEGWPPSPHKFTKVTCPRCGKKITQPETSKTRYCTKCKPHIKESFVSSTVKKLTEERLVFDASELNLRPGQWPATLTLSGKVYTRDRKSSNADGELVSVDYVADDWSTATVFND